MNHGGTTITRPCTYCGAMVTRRIPPSQRVPDHIYCSREHRHLSIVRERGKIPLGAPIKFPRLHDIEWLRQALSTKTPREVAEQIGCSYGAVIKAANRYEIEWVKTMNHDETKLPKWARDELNYQRERHVFWMSRAECLEERARRLRAGRPPTRAD